MAAGLMKHVLRHLNVTRCERIISKHWFLSPAFPFGVHNMASRIQRLSSAAERFEDAKLKLKTISEEPSDDTKLKLYALFKQASIGSCTTSRPSVLDFVGRAKWDAWNSLGSLSQDDAKEQYVALINQLLGEGQAAPSAKQNTDEADIFVTKQNNVTTITLNRPRKKNALTPKMYDGIRDALKASADDSGSIITMITGNGDYYCSGNDLTNFTSVSGGDVAEIARASKELLKRFVGAFIDFPKPLVIAANGPAVGVSVTVMGLCDIVYATDKATFHTPFSNLGQSPEGCSSYIFPKLMGYSKANEMLLFNKKITAAEAKNLGLVTEVFPQENFSEEVESRVQEMAKLPEKCLVYSKKLIRDVDKELLHKVNEEECERLVERWQSPDCMNAVISFLQRKSTL